MSKAEKFIQDYTRNCSNEFEPQKAPPSVYNPWLTPDQARRAVEIAREEMMEQTLDFLKDRLYKTGYVGIIDLCDDYIKTMRYE